MREPVRLLKCKTVDLEVPAEAEIVLEGVLRPNAPIEEGPVSEFPGFYVCYGPGIAGEVKCVTTRADPIYQAVLPGFAAEHCLLGAVAIESVVSDALQRAIPLSGASLSQTAEWDACTPIVTMHRPRLGEGKRAVLLAMGQVNLLKLVIVVEADIDPEDWRAVEWSLAARFRGHEDLIVLAGRQGGSLRSGAGAGDGHENRHDCNDPARRWSDRQPLRVRAPAGRYSGSGAGRA